MKKHKQISLLLTILVTSSVGSFAATIFSNTITDTNPSASNPYTNSQTFDSNLTVSGIGRGLGITADSAANRYSATSWNTVSLDTTAYFTWTLTPIAGQQINFTSLVYTGQASGTGPTSFSFRSSVDSFTSDIGTPTSTGTTIVLTNAAFQGITTAVEFRLYGWNASGGAGTFSVNDFTFNGALSAVPEPSTYTLLGGLAALGLIGARRFRSRRMKSATQNEVAG